MDFFSVLTMVGGLALFLYGMDAMGNGLSKLSGGKLESILEKLTSNKFKGVLLGALVTAVIQSSSATTVMVVGFVNSGIMKLTQAISIIMGANVGTTITSWILSLSSIESSNFFVRLFKPTSFAPVLALIGVAMMMFSKKEKKHDIGTILIGFAILMTGMETMSDAVKPLADVPEFTNILTMFTNPILGMISGAVLTAVIQSSSASVGILQALCATGALPYSVALPIIMGQNIGTCVTAMISGIGASKNAKRAAVVHLYFNLIGTIVFVIIFYSINMFVHFEFLNDPANGAGIAFIHSAFNILATILLLPFSGVLEKLACATIKDSTGEVAVIENEFKVLDDRFLDQPAFAMEQCKGLAIKMAKLSRKALFYSIDLIKEYDEDKFKEVEEIENRVDHYEDELGTYMVKLSSKNLSENDSKTLSMLLHLIGDFERISDHAINIAEIAKDMHSKESEFSKKAQKEMVVFTAALREIMDLAVDVFEEDDVTKATLVEPLEEVIDQINSEIKKRHVKRLRKGKCTIEMGFILSDFTTNFERVADHCSNVAVCVIQIEEDKYDTHGYLETLDKSENTDFRQNYEIYKEKYMLP